MKIISSVIVVIAIILIGYNATLVNYQSPFEEDSIIAIIGIVASLCAILLLVILTISRKIQKKLKEGD
ncbi:hypothetical protein [Leptobacterium sp. I13]|uniref:hypothetical protein n=1 Tax=Leptobacterium meishanense TaxID=3128904 RepID=UPI0030EC3540